MKDIPFLSPKTHQTTFEINLGALRHNLRFFKSLIGDSKLIVMVKAFAYGLGLSKISEILESEKVDYLAVAYTDEAVELRKAGIKMPLLVFNPEPHCFDNIIRFNLQPEIYSIELLKTYLAYIKNNSAYQMITPLPIHVKIDSGMHRLGILEEEVDTFISLLKKSNALEVKSVFTHLSSSDIPEHDEFTSIQIKCFEQCVMKFKQEFGNQIQMHVLSTAGIARIPEYKMDMVRLGIGLYGVSNVEETRGKLQTVCTLKSRIAQVKKVKKGETIGYGRVGNADKDMSIAIVFLGYADGLPRQLSDGRGKLFINGKFAPIVGNVCMDITMIDVTGLNVNVGDVAEVFGENYPVEEYAKNLCTIPYEVFTDISSRVRRIYLE